MKNQKGFSLLSIIAAIVVMGFLATVALTKMSSNVDVMKEAAAAKCAARALNTFESQKYGVFILQNGTTGTATAYWQWFAIDDPASSPYFKAGTDLKGLLGVSGYQWVNGDPLIDGGDMSFDGYTFTLVRDYDNGIRGMWSFN